MISSEYWCEIYIFIQVEEILVNIMFWYLAEK